MEIGNPVFDYGFIMLRCSVSLVLVPLIVGMQGVHFSKLKGRIRKIVNLVYSTQRWREFISEIETVRGAYSKKRTS